MKRRVVLPAAILTILILAGLGWMLRPLFASEVYAGVTVANIDVGGKTCDEVAQILLMWQKDHLDKPILLSHNDLVFRLEPQNIDFSIDAASTAETAWKFGREGSWWERLKNIRHAKQQGYLVPLKIKYNENKLDDIFRQLQEMVEQPPQNATLSLLKGGLVPEQAGKQLDIPLLRDQVLAALNRLEAGSISLPVKAVNPDITAADIAENNIKEPISVYTTTFSPEDVNRTANIKLAAQKINGWMIHSGQVFSFNDIVGPREKPQGFKEAMEIINGEFVPGIGGGICQVSSTLYNAVLMAGLDIVERTNHSKPLVYVPLGRDATVVYGLLDFKFLNNSSAPLMIMAETSGNKLYIGIFGQRSPEKTIEIVTAEKQTIEPTVIKKADPDLPMGGSKVEKQGKPGYEVTTIRLTRDATGHEIRREVLSKDRYLPDNTVMRVGLQAKPVQKADDSKD
ncbi:MAG TPA: VanW family protein [Methylomusa anaerophila]|uniref:Vancomycin B-type resistance protein VanW n=1 Tax=Methylomusa anaerophila TaxID=1930071 RepID=A0A348AJT6_9FIRM|nr:VanW family protein [Methylomusa anaerophila]BBB91334.1 vancomycin B-type resistance protein VanW [Methylomusa anaerophila]HML90491.1 VanW family protein [Methylomusa anaerophila]